MPPLEEGSPESTPEPSSEAEAIEEMRLRYQNVHASTEAGWRERTRATPPGATPPVREGPAPPRSLAGGGVPSREAGEGVAEDEAAFSDPQARAEAMVEWLNRYADSETSQDPESTQGGDTADVGGNTGEAGEPPLPPPFNPALAEPPPFNPEGDSPMQTPEPSPEDARGQHTLSGFERLARLGYAERRVWISGNAVDIRTLTQREEMLVLEEVGKYAMSASRRAQQVFAVALCIRQVNGSPYRARSRLGPGGAGRGGPRQGETMGEASRRELGYLFEKTLDSFYPSVIDMIHGEYAKLRDETDEKALYLGKGSPT